MKFDNFLSDTIRAKHEKIEHDLEVFSSIWADRDKFESPQKLELEYLKRTWLNLMAKKVVLDVFAANTYTFRMIDP